MRMRLSHASCTSLHISLQETFVKIAADGVVDKALLLCRLIARHVAEHDVVIPAPLHVGRRTAGGLHERVATKESIGAHGVFLLLLFAFLDRRQVAKDGQRVVGTGGGGGGAEQQSDQYNREGQNTTITQPDRRCEKRQEKKIIALGEARGREVVIWMRWGS